MKTLAPNESRVVRLVPNEGTAQLVDQVRIQNRSYYRNNELVGRFEVTMANARGVRTLETEHRTDGNAFTTYADAAAYANDWIRRNNRHAIK